MCHLENEAQQSSDVFSTFISGELVLSCRNYSVLIWHSACMLMLMHWSPTKLTKAKSLARKAKHLFCQCDLKGSRSSIQ